MFILGFYAHLILTVRLNERLFETIKKMAGKLKCTRIFHAKFVLKQNSKEQN